jgi:hypothetical protein
MGTTDRERIATDFNLLAQNRINKLRANATSIMLGISSHDVIVPSVGQWRLAKTYLDAGLDVEVERHFVCGHGSCKAQLPKLSDLSNALVRLNASSRPRSEKFVTAGRVLDFLVNERTGLSEPRSRQTLSNPLTIELPRIILPDAPAPVILTGTPEKRYAIILRDCTNRDFGFVVQLDAAGTAIHTWPTALPSGVIRVTGIFEVNQSHEPVRKILMRTILRGNPPLVFERYDADTRALGRDVPFAILRVIAGERLENCYVDQGLGLGCLNNYGAIESTSQIVNTSDITLVRRALGPITPTPTPPSASNGCSAAEEAITFISPDGSNTCQAAWPQAAVGETISVVARSTRGGADGTVEGLCHGRESWSFSYLCPNKTGATCAGGRLVVPSVPNRVKECIFHWNQASEGSPAVLLSNTTQHNGGTIAGTCQATGWNFEYQCADPGVKTCSGGAITAPSASGGQACRFSWPSKVTGQSHTGKPDPGFGSASGKITASCVDEGGLFGVWKNVAIICP